MESNKNLVFIELNSCASTNDELHSLAVGGAADGTVVVAKTQTNGRGTNGRSFFSHGETGVYMSVLLRGIESENVLHVTPLAAVVVSHALDELCKVNSKIKKVNDIFLDGKKVCGILTQSESNGKNINFVIVGIGVNLFKPQNGFPKEIFESAGFVLENYDGDLKKKFIKTVADDLVGAAKRLSDAKFVERALNYYENKAANNTLA